ncbi:MAG TPA: GDSL-type esterase/lipase family protein [Chitinophagaceae bacterium]|nr:GDSL-type esterase/lipase family protein [Chitinophagaceae bacterium]
MKLWTRLVTGLFLSAFVWGGQHAYGQMQPIRVACVGNSITEGAGLGDSTYPKQLQVLLGKNYDVRNYGLGGRTLLKHGDIPYWKEQKFQEVQGWNPQIVIIMLGTNDTKPWNWKYAAEFIPDYKAFIEVFRKLPSHPRIWICDPVPVFRDNYGIRESVMKNEVIPDIAKISRAEKVPVIDMYKAEKGKGAHFKDGVHPDGYGDSFLAEAAFKSIHRYKPPEK